LSVHSPFPAIHPLFFFLSVAVLEWLKTKTAEDLEKYAEPILSACFPLLLDQDLEPRIASTFRNCWDLLATLIPQHLWVTAVNLMAQPSEKGKRE